MATTEERFQLRKHLMDLGFERVDYTSDLEGTGAYQEVFENVGNRITLTWGPKTDHDEFLDPDQCRHKGPREASSLCVMDKNHGGSEHTDKDGGTWLR